MNNHKLWRAEIIKIQTPNVYHIWSRNNKIIIKNIILVLIPINQYMKNIDHLQIEIVKWMNKHNLTLQTFTRSNKKIIPLNTKRIDLIISDKSRLIIDNLKMVNIIKPISKI